MFDILGIGKILGLASSALNFATPIISAVTAFSKWYFTEMYDGLKTIFSNFSTLVVVGTVVVVSTFYGTQIATCGPVFPDNKVEKQNTSKPWRYDFDSR